AITPRLERVQLASVLESWFGLGSDATAAIQGLQAATKWLTLPAGATLYRPGDEADGMYLVVSGRLQVRPSGEAHAYPVGRGESVGDLGVLGGAARTETVTAIRDSHLLRVPTHVVERHPQVMARIARGAVERLSGAGPTTHGNGLRTVALLPAHDGADVQALADLMRPHLEALGPSLRIDEPFVAGAFGGSLPAPGSALDASLTHWLNELEAENSSLVLLAPSTSSQAWVERCRRQADAVLLVADSGQPAAAAVSARPPDQLVLVHAAETALPGGTAAWLERTGVEEWHHVRLGDGRGVARLVRRLTGTAVGLVFSGGGARGYAHIGLLRAIDELGIEIDMVAGTSMGALIAAGHAFADDWHVGERSAVAFAEKKRLLDKTLPLVALTKSQGVTNTYRSIFGDTRIEDLWTPFVCVSANLFEAVPVEHTTGPIWEAVRASSAIPGIFTPFVREGALLVDGA